MAGFQDDSDKKVEPEEVEYGTTDSPKPRTFGGKVKRHCARFWWLHLIIFCIVFLIIALCLVYVAMPKIAQDGVNDASLEITELKFTDPTANSVVISQKGILHSPSMYTPTLDPFNASSYLVTNGTYGAEPMVMIEMPRIHAHHPQGPVSVDQQNVTIMSLDQLSAYTTAVLSSEYVTTALVGKTRLHLGSLPDTTVHYNQTSTYKGLNGLAGFNVTGVKINLAAKAGQPNLSGFAYIPNPSNMTIVMGNVTLSLSTAKAGTVGNSTINDMTLVPGNNTLPMTGIMDQTLVLGSMDTKTGLVELEIVGKSAVYNGEHLVYYERALASNKLSLAMNVSQILKDSLSGSV
ncbi:pre-mRNA processing factor 4 protein [Rutstroemia sp. NJR-2017a WRK4]|nr:pre-mRNA processing factor 4 protein [Rutstroemia sp. NJR-2017a WRK4]PQE11818.1 pre-mRNA processing factor 4 protein [Rutstroemia sp. NJR-2017a WRK4]